MHFDNSVLASTGVIQWLLLHNYLQLAHSIIVVWATNVFTLSADFMCDYALASILFA